MCEKPLGMDYAETRLIYEAAKSSGLRHMTAFTYRFVPALNYIRHLVPQRRAGANSPRAFSAVARLGRKGHRLASV